MINYQGLFFEGEEAQKILEQEKNKLEVPSDILHCTFKYKPEEKDMYDELVGNYYDVTLVGYASDKNNSGFILLIDKRLEKYYKNVNENGKIIPPHITCSISKESEPVETGELKFEILDKMITVKGRFGYCIKDENDECHISYEKALKNKEE